MELQKFVYMGKNLMLIYICDMVFEQNKQYKSSNCSGNMAKKFISLIATCSFGKTRTMFENLRTPSCSAHHSGSRFVNHWKGY